MQILSRYLDYYDVSAQAQTSPTLFVRESLTLPLTAFKKRAGWRELLKWSQRTPAPTVYRRNGQTYRVVAGWLLIAGRLHPFARVRKQHNGLFYDDLYFYNETEFNEWQRTHFGAPVAAQPSRLRQLSRRMAWPTFWAQSQSFRFSSLAMTEGLPLLAWNHAAEGQVEANPRLQPLQLARHLEADTVAHSLERFCQQLNRVQVRVPAALRLTAAELEYTLPLKAPVLH